MILCLVLFRVLFTTLMIHQKLSYQQEISEENIHLTFIDLVIVFFTTITKLRQGIRNLEGYVFHVKKNL